MDMDITCESAKMVSSGPMFHLAPPEERLDPDDAELVDVIHTAGRWVGMDGIVLEWVFVFYRM